MCVRAGGRARARASVCVCVCVCVWTEFENVHLLLTEFDRPEVTLYY